MICKAFVLLCCCFAVFAQSYDVSEQLQAVQEGQLSSDQLWNQIAPLQRMRRQVTAQGGGSPGKGVDFNVDARKNVWTSDNKRHEVDLTGGYAQHLGGPYGNCPPQWRTGGIYTYGLNL